MKNNENNDQQNEIMDEELFEEQTKSYSVATLSAIILVSAGLIAGAWYIYKSYQNKNYDEVVVVSADQEEIKVQPLDPGGMIVDNMDKDIYNTIDKNYKNNEKVEVLLPPSEEPIDKKDLLLADMSPSVKKMEEAPTPQDAPIPTAPPVAKTASVPAPETKETIAKPLPKKALPVVTPPKLEEISSVASKAEEEVEYIKPVTKKESKQKPQFTKKPEASYKVQIASFKSASDAEKEWKILSKRFSKLLGSYQRYIVSKDIEGKGVFQRLQVGPFESESTAKKACSQFKEAGMKCFVVKP